MCRVQLPRHRRRVQARGTFGAGVKGDRGSARAADGADRQRGEGPAAAGAANGTGFAGWFPGKRVPGHAGTAIRTAPVPPGPKGTSWPGTACAFGSGCSRCRSQAAS
jgi:hypothetical protein